MEYREGQSTRCGYCGVSQWCDQFAAMHSKDEDDERSDPVPPESNAEAEGEDAAATKMIVAWAYEDEEQVEYRFITGGQDSDLSTLGIIEMTKSMVLEG